MTRQLRLKICVNIWYPKSDPWVGHILDIQLLHWKNNFFHFCHLCWLQSYHKPGLYAPRPQKIIKCTYWSLQLINLYFWNIKRWYSQVLFSEQTKIRATIRGNSQTEIADKLDQESSPSSTNKEVKALKTELETVKAQMAELQRDYSELQQEYQKQKIKQRSQSGWTVGWRKIRKSALFNLKIDGEETDESHNRPNQSCRGSFLRRQSGPWEILNISSLKDLQNNSILAVGMPSIANWF